MTQVDFDREAVTALFAAEAEEGLGAMEQAVLRLESRPDDAEALGTLFREAHTLKGNSAALGYPALCELAHAVEDLLHRRREGQLALTRERVTLLLECLDALSELVRLAISGDAERMPASVPPLLERLSESVRLEELPGADVAPAGAADETASNARSEARGGRTLRIDLARLDQMLSLTGEIAVARGQLKRLLSESESSSRALDTHAEMDRLASDLQELVLKVRMLPLGPLFRQLRRTVRDVAAACGKGVRLELVGEAVEADTSVIEQLKDSLNHMIRNAVDHGIETPAQRLEAGKSAEGRILVSARHESGGLVVEVQDDGCGLDRERIVERARARGLVRENQRLTNDDVDNLIFEPGLSTARSVTEVSGRGVGLDVVRRNVQALRGSLRVQSRPGAGTTITLRLPLTLAIIPGFAVALGAETFVIPMDGVLECLELPPGIAQADAAGSILSLRGDALPCLDLVEHFRIERGAAPPRRAVVVVRDARLRAGLVVDALIGQSQSVIRPLGRLFEGIPGLLGSTVGDDGRVGHILDVPVLLARAAAASKFGKGIETQAGDGQQSKGETSC